MKLMLHYIKRHIGMFLIAVVFLTIETFADLLQPTFMSYIVDRGVKGQETELILRYGLIMLGITGRRGRRGAQYLRQQDFPAHRQGDSTGHL